MRSPRTFFSMLILCLAALASVGCVENQPRRIAENSAAPVDPAPLPKICGVWDVYHQDQRQPIGTAFQAKIDGKRFFLTALHVVSGLFSDELSLVNSCGKSAGYIEKIIGYEPVGDLDLAYLAIDDLAFKRYRNDFDFSQQPRDWATRVVFPGRLIPPADILPTVPIPISGEVQGTKDGMLYVKWSSHIDKGISGSPVLDPNSKSIVAMITSAVRYESKPTNFGYGPTSDTIVEALRFLISGSNRSDASGVPGN